MTTGDGDVIEGFLDALLDDDAETLYDRAPCGYLSTTPDGLITKVNATFLTLTGYTREELVDRRRFAELLSVGGRLYHETHYMPLLRIQGSAREIAFELVCADGERLPVLVNAVLEQDAAHLPRVIRTAVFDASQRRRYETELLREKQRAEASEERAAALARTLQQTLIPPRLPEIAGLEVAAEYRPAGDGSEVGGDFYDIFQTGADDWVVVLGDVCGKGAEAAVITALVRFTLRAVAMQHRSSADALSAVNDALRGFPNARFCTAVMLRLTRHGADWMLSCCAAGHPLPLHADGNGGATEMGRWGTLLGVLPEVRLYESTAILTPGDVIVAYTDGVTEARPSDGAFYGEERLLDLVARASDNAAGIAGSLLADVLTYQEGDARDDIAIVVLRVPPTGAGAAPE